MKFSAILLVSCFWICLITASILFLSSKKVKHYDPNGLLALNASGQNFDKEFKTIFTDRSFTFKNAVVHFFSDNCFCRTVAQSHINSVTALASEQGYEQFSFDVDDLSDINEYIPSIPSVAVFDTNENLVYLGPYSSGIFCTEGNGLVEPFIKKDLAIRSLPGAIIMSEAKGCYCETTEA